MQPYWTVLLDITLAAAILYYLYTWLVRTRSAAIVIGLLALVVLYFAADALGLHLTTGILQGFYAVALIAVIIIFQPELRRILENVGFIGGRSGHGAVSPTSLRALSETLFELAAKRTGALVVLPGRGPIDRHITGGVELSGVLSPQLLASIFDHHSAGHDGAAILDSEQITKFACYLPLSQQLDLSPRYGTRHRAALGISEVSDCLAIVVSEERGDVSIARNGELMAQPNAAVLEREIQGFLRAARPGSQPGRRGWRRLARRPVAKLGAVAAAAGLWFLTAYQEAPTAHATVEARIQHKNVPKNLYVAALGAEIVYAELEGPPDLITQLQAKPPPLVLDFLDVVAGHQEIAISAEHFDLPDGVRLVDAQPNRVVVRLVAFRVSKAPVIVQVEGEPADGWRVGQVIVDPTTVRVIHKANTPLLELQVVTDRVNVDGAKKDVEVTAKLIWPTGLRPAEGEPESVAVRVRLNEFTAPPLAQPPAGAANTASS